MSLEHKLWGPILWLVVIAIAILVCYSKSHGQDVVVRRGLTATVSPANSNVIQIKWEKGAGTTFPAVYNDSVRSTNWRSVGNLTLYADGTAMSETTLRSNAMYFRVITNTQTATRIEIPHPPLLQPN